MRLRLIPAGRGGDVVGQRFVAPVRPPAQGLHCDPEVLREPDAVQQVPPVEAVTARPFRVIGLRERQSEEG